ncbi:MAG TPA: hypothetical protein VK348_01470 [Planctomycetota bacterium]|nr:hypothetical protein [Planctomycetota bacterium]
MTIREHQRARPFKPFRICLADGTSYEVRNPAHMLVSAIHVFIGVEIDDEDMPDHFDMRDPTQVTRIEPLPENGQPG